MELLTQAECAYVFTDGHGVASYTQFYDDPVHLDKVDWDMVFQQYWRDNTEDMDRQRRKQAELLVHHSCPWAVVRGIGVFDEGSKARTEAILSRFGEELRRRVAVQKRWYYP